MKRQAALRCCVAVNADRRFGRWHYRVAKAIAEIVPILDEAGRGAAAG